MTSARSVHGKGYGIERLPGGEPAFPRSTGAVAERSCGGAPGEGAVEALGRVNRRRGVEPDPSITAAKYKRELDIPWAPDFSGHGHPERSGPEA